MRAVKVWDLPVRLVHWAIVVLVAVSWFTITYASGERVALFTTLHELSGYTILALLLFRIVWGFAGSETARFGRFLRSPAEALRHLLHFFRRGPDDQVGHNPAGGWMVIVLLVTLGVQAVSGLFTYDEMPEGPFGGLVPERTAYWLTAMHHANFNILLGVMALHVVAIAAYAVIRRETLLRPMITGRKHLPDGVRPPMMASVRRAAMILALAAGAVAFAVTAI